MSQSKLVENKPELKGQWTLELHPLGGHKDDSDDDTGDEDEDEDDHAALLLLDV